MGISSASGMSQSLDAPETLERDSFEEVKVKRTSSAPSREGTPPNPAQPSTSKQSIFAITTAETAHQPSTVPFQDIEVRPEVKGVEYISVDVGEEPNFSGRKGVPSPGSQKLSSNCLTTPIMTGSKLHGIVQPIKTSANSSGWL